MTQVSNEAVWKVCRYLQGTCNDCPREVETQYGPGAIGCFVIAQETIEKSLSAVSEHPAGLPEGWVKGQGS